MSRTAVSIISSNDVPIPSCHRDRLPARDRARHPRGGATVMDSVFGDPDHDPDNGSGHGTDAETA
jgi:hypothetical protein